MDRDTSTAIRCIVPIGGSVRQKKNGKPEERAGNPDAKRELGTHIEQVKSSLQFLLEKFEELRETAFELKVTQDQLDIEQTRAEESSRKVAELQAALDRAQEEIARLHEDVQRRDKMLVEATQAFEEERERMARSTAPAGVEEFSGEVSEEEMEELLMALTEPPTANAPSADPDAFPSVPPRDDLGEVDLEIDWVDGGEGDSEFPPDDPESQGEIDVVYERPRDTQMYGSDVFASPIPAALDPVPEEPEDELRRTTAGYEELRVPAMPAQPEDRAQSSEEPPPVPPIDESWDEPRSEDGGRKTLIFSPAPASTEVPVGENPGPVPSVRSDGSPLPTKRQQVRVTNKPKNGSNGS
jgi:hypothetical protein